MEINSLSNQAASITPRTNQVEQTSVAPPPETLSNTPPPANEAATEISQQAPSNAAPVQAPAETTDLNELLLRNTASPAATEAQQNPELDQRQRDTERNQLEDRFNTLQNDAPAPNIDVSA